MHDIRHRIVIVALTGALGAASAGQAPQAPPRPLGTQDAADFDENTMYLYWDANFGGGDPHQVHPVTFHDDAVLLKFEDQKFLKNIRDDMSSLKWNLPPGVIVVFYEDAAAKGERIVIWGRGQIRSLENWSFNDKVSRWAWYYVGGAPPPSRDVTGRAEYAVSPLTVALDNSIQLWQHTDFRGDLDPITRVTRHPEGVLLPITDDLRDSMSSLRWSLPEGVAVIFYENSSGKGRHFGVWAEGEIPKLLHWDFNDKLSRWAWYSVAPRPTANASRVCSSVDCGRQLPRGANFCPGCGTAVAITTSFCANCGHKRPPGEQWSNCPKCGEPWGN